MSDLETVPVKWWRVAISIVVCAIVVSLGWAMWTYDPNAATFMATWIRSMVHIGGLVLMIGGVVFAVLFILGVVVLINRSSK